MSSNFWKFYCWIYATITAPLAVVEIANINKWRFVDYLFIPLLILDFLLLYSYAYKVKIFHQNIWKTVWWYHITWIVITIIFYSPPFDEYYPDLLKSYYYFEQQPVQSDQSFLFFVLVCLAIMIPLYFANYVLAFDGKYLNSKNSKKS